jgi:hypothetical protein
MDDDGGEMLPLGVRVRPVEFECVSDAEGASGEHASDETMMEWRLGACGRVCLGNGEVAAMDDEADEDRGDDGGVNQCMDGRRCVRASISSRRWLDSSSLLLSNSSVRTTSRSVPGNKARETSPRTMRSTLGFQFSFNRMTTVTPKRRQSRRRCWLAYPRSTRSPLPRQDSSSTRCRESCSRAGLK